MRICLYLNIEVNISVLLVIWVIIKDWLFIVICNMIFIMCILLVVCVCNKFEVIIDLKNILLSCIESLYGIVL